MSFILKQDKKLPNFICKSLYDYKLVDINSISKPLFILFWCLSCKYSIEEIININSNIIRKYKDKIEFIFINCGDNKSEINEYLNKHKTKILIKNIKQLNICLDSDDYIVNSLNIEEIPTTIITDENLIVKSIIIGKNKIEKYINLISSVIKQTDIKEQDQNQQKDS